MDAEKQAQVTEFKMENKLTQLPKKSISDLDVGFIDDMLGFIEASTGSEKHCASSYAETGDASWLQLLKKIRRDRGEALSLIIPKSDAQLYCYSKHTARMSEHAIEIANRFNEEGNDEMAKEYYQKADVYEKTIKFLIEKYKGGQQNGI